MPIPNTKRIRSPFARQVQVVTPNRRNTALTTGLNANNEPVVQGIKRMPSLLARKPN